MNHPLEKDFHFAGRGRGRVATCGTLVSEVMAQKSVCNFEVA